MAGSLPRRAKASLGLLFGRTAPGGTFERWVNARLFLVPALVPLVLGLAICLTVLVVDPLDLRPWGLQPRFYDGNYPELVTPKLVRAVSRQHEDVLLVGGSQAMGVTPAQLRGAFEAREVFNLSYSLLEARDLDAVSQAAVRTPGLKRLIVELPFTAAEWDRPPALTGAGAIAVLRARWYALPDFGDDIARGSLERVVSGHFATPEWRREASQFLGSRNLRQNEALMAQLELGFRQIPSANFRSTSPLPCSQFAVIGKSILPLIEEAASRSVELDFYFPPIPPASYPRAEVQQSGLNRGWFRQLMSFHRCVALAVTTANGSNVHLLAIDLDPVITGDLSNFRDTFHLVRPDKFDRLLNDVKAHRFELGAAQANPYSDQLSRLILAEYRKRGLL